MAKRLTLLLVEWDDHGDPRRDWGYHLRMGGIDAEVGVAVFESHVDDDLAPGEAAELYRRLMVEPSTTINPDKDLHEQLFGEPS